METKTETKLSRDFKDLQYHEGFGNHASSEAEKDALPKGQNAPQKCPYGLYAEQLSGTAFTKSRDSNQRSWLYRIKPSVTHIPFKKSSKENYPYIKNDFMNDKNISITPNQLRWKALPEPKSNKNFIESLVTVGGAGDPSLKQGLAIYLYACNVSMGHNVFNSSDGDMLIVPQTGTLYITTEFGKLTAEPLEIVVIPRGIRFTVDITEFSRGWIVEVFKGHFRIPDLGPIGANGLANPRDFKIPHAWYEKVNEKFIVHNKYLGEMYECEMDHSPFDVVAWHGNYVPYKYHLSNFNTIGTISFDHPDPSIFTVLTAPTDEPGVATCDFVIFPPRWMVGENTFRPPYYHRNCMSEYMGNIKGVYDAKEAGFGPGCSSLHSHLTPHGPETDVFEKASNVELKPTKIENTMSFMFETSYFIKTTEWVMDGSLVELDNDYYKCWQGLKDHFTK